METIDINDTIWIELTAAGRSVYEDVYQGRHTSKYTAMQLWDFVNIFGGRIGIANDPMITGGIHLTNPLDQPPAAERERCSSCGYPIAYNDHGGFWYHTTTKPRHVAAPAAVAPTRPGEAHAVHWYLDAVETLKARRGEYRYSLFGNIAGVYAELAAWFVEHQPQIEHGIVQAWANYPHPIALSAMSQWRDQHTLAYKGIDQLLNDPPAAGAGASDTPAIAPAQEIDQAITAINDLYMRLGGVHWFDTNDHRWRECFQYIKDELIRLARCKT